MKIRKVWSTAIGAMIFGGLIALAPVTPSLAQSSSNSASAAKKSTVTALKGETRHVRPHTRKHRYWRHRGGSHPHYGSRRIRH